MIFVFNFHELIRLILESLNRPDIEIQDNWINEPEKRYDAYSAGKVKALSFEEVIKRLES
ncbi:MAG: hypothetical protein B6D64_10180 [Bacteroidetes bacterium 4484_276]|nr:MAG: hypothetical protein B6D64_10180 [Bacteroidetes bacterium 4484_276]